MGDTVVDSFTLDNRTFEGEREGRRFTIPALDITATTDSKTGAVRISVVNRHPDQSIPLRLTVAGTADPSSATWYSLTAKDKNDYNDIGHCGIVKEERDVITDRSSGSVYIEVPPHSVNVIVLRASSG
jgi:alpha-L-arabinofuranosidase